MGYLLSKRTADELIDIIASRGLRKVGPYNAPRDVGVSEEETKPSFDVTISGNVASILAGTIRLAWTNIQVSAVTTLTLSGSTAWIYVYMTKATGATGITFSSDEPISTGANFQWPLVRATSSDGGTTYSIADGDIRHEGDFYFYSPINKP